MDAAFAGGATGLKRNTIFLGLFCAVSVIELVALSYELTFLHRIAKTLIMLGLIGYYESATENRSSTFVRALFFCWAGDVLLLFQGQGEMFFIAGLLAFLVGHILYIVSYRKHQWKEAKQSLLPTEKLRYSFPVILIGTGLIVVLFPTLGGLRIPVLIYAVVLMIMVMTAIFRYGKTSSASYGMVLTGASLFMVSDSILAIDKFFSPLTFASFLIMGTYVAAQYFIVEGIIRHESQSVEVIVK